MLKKFPLLAAFAVVLMLSGCFEDEKKTEAPAAEKAAAEAPAAGEAVETAEGMVSDAVIMDGGEEKPVEIAEEAAPAVDKSLLTDTEWELEDIKGASVILGKTATLKIDPQGTVNGNGTCNQFSARAQIKDDGQLGIGSIMSTKRACADMAQNSQEAAYMMALGEVTAWRVDEENGLLYLTNRKGEEVLRFAKPAAAEVAPEQGEAAPAEGETAPAE